MNWTFFIISRRDVGQTAMCDCDMFWSYSPALGILVCYVSMCFVTFLYGFLGLVLYLIVLIPDLCLLSSL